MVCPKLCTSEIVSLAHDAPLGLRQEYVDVIYFLFERLPSGFREADEKRLYHVISQCHGIQPSGAQSAAEQLSTVAIGDWLIDPASYIAKVHRSADGKEVELLTALSGVSFV